MTIFNCALAGVSDPVLAQAACSVLTAVERGELVVIPTDTVYGIGTAPHLPTAVNRLLATKGRGKQMPPPILVPSVDSIHDFAEPSDIALELAQKAWPGALTLIVPAPALGWEIGNTHGTVAVRMPNHKVAQSILEITGPLAVTSANLTGKAPALSVGEAVAYFRRSVSVYVDAGPSPTNAIASTIVDTTGMGWKVLRQGALSPLDLEQMVKSIPWDVSMMGLLRDLREGNTRKR